jgi:hypothetical protein
VVRQHKDGSCRKRENTDSKTVNKKKMGRDGREDRQIKVIKEERKGVWQL